MQSEYQGSAEAWKQAMQRLAAEGCTFTEKSGDNSDCRFFEVEDGSSHSRGLWVEITTKTKDGKQPILIIDVHWLTRTKDPKPDWMLLLAAKLEQYLEDAGSRCVFGAVRADSYVKKRLGVRPTR